jgi:thiamine biosynthesis lipoprotein
MGRLDLLPVGPDTQQWPLWSTTARLVVLDPVVLPDARRIVDTLLAAVDEACSRFRADSELGRLDPGRPTIVSPLLAELTATALTAAQRTGGDVDPTIGLALESLGYDRDLALLHRETGDVPVSVRHAAGWREIGLTGRELTVPDGVRLDFGATAKAFAADRCARLVAAHCDTGVLVSLGGDLATAGEAPDGGWTVLVSDGPDQPSCVIRLAAGMALATSSTIARTWRRGGRLLHHVLDPRTCQPARPVWRTVSVAAPSCVEANTWTTAALVRGQDALATLRELGFPARLVAGDGAVRTLNDWPAEDGV